VLQENVRSTAKDMERVFAQAGADAIGTGCTGFDYG